jgi:phosphoglycolate phosphatase
MLRRYQHIIWDWNGTLLDDVDLSIEIANGILRRRGLPVMDRARYHAVFDFPVRNYYASLGLDTTGAGFHEISTEWIAEYDRRRWEVPLHRGAVATLDAVLAQGRTQSILSAYRHETLCEIVGHFGLTSRFVRLSGLDNIYADSKAALGKACLAELGIPPQDVVMVGDTLHDFDVAEQIGVDCVLVAHGHHPLDRLAARSEHVFTDLPSLAKALGLEVAGDGL